MSSRDYIWMNVPHTANVYSCPLMIIYGWMSRTQLMCIHVYSCFLIAAYRRMSSTRPLCIHVLSWLYDNASHNMTIYRRRSQTRPMCIHAPSSLYIDVCHAHGLCVFMSSHGCMWQCPSCIHGLSWLYMDVGPPRVPQDSWTWRPTHHHKCQSLTFRTTNGWRGCTWEDGRGMLLTRKRMLDAAAAAAAGGMLVLQCKANKQAFTDVCLCHIHKQQ